MEVGVLYDVKPAVNTLLSFYFAPVGDPAIGATAYPHRASAAEGPVPRQQQSPTTVIVLTTEVIKRPNSILDRMCVIDVTIDDKADDPCSIAIHTSIVGM